MKKSIIILFLIISNFSFACSCIGKSSIKKEFKYRNVVLIGKIISKKIYQETDVYQEHKLDYPKDFPEKFIPKKAVYEILVIEKLKGEIKTDTIKIYTGLGNGDCGVNFKIGENYIIYSNYEDEHFNNGIKNERFLTTDICTSTQQFEEKEYKKVKRFAKRKGYC